MVGWLTISAFEKLLIFNSFSAPFSFPFLFFPLHHPSADSFQPVRTCPCSEKEQEGIRAAVSVSATGQGGEWKGASVVLLLGPVKCSQACNFIKQARNFKSQAG